MKLLFSSIRRIEGAPLTQAEVDEINAVLAAEQVSSVRPPHFEVMARHLEAEEGRVRHAYQDHLGFWTIGVGRLIDKRKGGCLSEDEIDTLLANDICRKIAEIEDWPSWQAVKDDPVRATAFLSMAFQMGSVGLSKFKNSLRLIEQKQWQAAAGNLMQSLWARQTPARAKRVTQMIATGKMP